jgi:hypothetical protein
MLKLSAIPFSLAAIFLGLSLFNYIRFYSSPNPFSLNEFQNGWIQYANWYNAQPFLSEDFLVLGTVLLIAGVVIASRRFKLSLFIIGFALIWFDEMANGSFLTTNPYIEGVLIYHWGFFHVHPFIFPVEVWDFISVPCLIVLSFFIWKPSKPLKTAKTLLRILWLLAISVLPLSLIIFFRDPAEWGIDVSTTVTTNMPILIQKILAPVTNMIMIEIDVPLAGATTILLLLFSLRSRTITP